VAAAAEPAGRGRRPPRVARDRRGHCRLRVRLLWVRFRTLPGGLFTGSDQGA